MNVKESLRQEVMNVMNKFDTEDDIQSEIHPDVDIMYNSVNILLGHRGSGKSFNAFNQAALISRVPNKFHLFVYISNNPNDHTWMKMKGLIHMPTVLVSYSESEQFLTELIDYKQAYDEIRQKDLEQLITDDCREDILKHLHIDDFSQKSLHTLILYDDAQEVFRKPSAKEFRYILENRHSKFTYMLNIQDWKGISMELKANVDSIWLFGGYPRIRYCYIYNQLACPIDKDILYDMYSQIPKRECLIFGYERDGMSVKHMYEDGCCEVLWRC